MKSFLLSLALITAFTFQSAAERILEGRAAHQDIPGAETIRYKDFTSVPNYIRFREDSRPSFAQWQNWIKQRYFKEFPQVSFKLIGQETDKLGMIHYRYQQLFDGYPLTFGIWIVHTHSGVVVSMNGELFDQVTSAQPALSEAAALNYALNHIGASVYKWEVALEEEAIKEMEQDINASYFPKGALEIVNPDITMETVELALAWKFNIYAHEPMSRQEVYINASTGAVVFENNLIHHADSNGTAETGYSGLRNIVTDFTGTQFRLRESGRGNGIFTFDMNNATAGQGTDFFHPDNDWDVATVERFGTDAHWGAEMTYDFFFNHFNRNSIDDQGFILRSRVHYGNNYANAFWDGNQMTYGDGSNGNSPFTALDIAGHEIAHGLTTFTANLVYQAEPGALNESFSDIFGAAIEFDALGFANGDWLMGEDLGFIIRTMNNPNQSGDPDTYFGTFWASLTGGDNGGVHTNSGVQNFWFYLLTEGGMGTNDNGHAYNVTGIGLNDAAAVAYRNLTTYLTVSSQYSDARYYAIQSAVDLYGACSQQVESTWKAWRAVGVGAPFTGEVIADFEADLTENCAAPTTVQFANYSMLGSNYLWNFGDGNTSTAFNPSHTYATDGSYTVTLQTTSSCGGDTTIQVDYINIGAAYPCQVILPSNGGLAPTQTACTGYLYDDGGPLGTYSSNYNSTITLAPTGAVNVTLEFVEFNIEADPTCSYDYLIIYNGANTGAPVIGTYCDGNLPPAMLTSTGSAITLQFHSDEALEEDGFKIAWQCNIPSETPIADFEADKEETCIGTISFNDLSAVGNNVATSWYWEFGDGNTSTLQHPTHQYQTSGIYDVTMVAINAIGTDTIVKTNYVNVDLPEAPIGADDDICPGEQGTLIVTSGGENVWYDNLFSTTPIHVGDTFVTPIVQQSTAYYVESQANGSSVATGAITNQIGGGGNFNFLQSLIFDVYDPCRLHSVKVYAGVPGDRNIVVYDNAGNLVHDTVIFVASGEQTLVLDFDFMPGTDYRISLAQGSTISLYRNSNGAAYPYTIPGVLSITRSSAQTDPLSYYYYYYDWQVQQKCISGRTGIAASTGICTGIDETIAENNLIIYPNPAQTSVNVSWSIKPHSNQLIILSATGQRVHAEDISNVQSQLEISTAHLSAGVYLIQLGEETRRLIIQ